MLDDFHQIERDELRQKAIAEIRAARRELRDAFAARDAEPEPEDEYHAPNQPRCTAKANGEVAARLAIALAQRNHGEEE